MGMKLGAAKCVIVRQARLVACSIAGGKLEVSCANKEGSCAYTPRVQSAE
jgi:hypothetical protein